MTAPQKSMVKSIALDITKLLSDLESRELIKRQNPISEDITGIEELAERVAVQVVQRFTGRNDSAQSPQFRPARYAMPAERLALTHKMTIHARDGEHEYYVSLGYYDDGNIGEVFLRKGGESGEGAGPLDALATVISIGLQHGIPWEVFEAKLARHRFEPSGPTESEEEGLRSVSSPLDYLARYVGARVKISLAEMAERLKTHSNVPR